MRFNAPQMVKRTDIDFEGVNFGDLHCGLFRCPLDRASELLPELKELFESAPVEVSSDWEVDVKIHMLMTNQFPCIPNWHCDNVPRFDGVTDYSKVDSNNPRMLLWISGGPHTEFLTKPTEMPTPMSHADLGDHIRNMKIETFKMPSQCWVSMDQTTPHKGTKAIEHTWRVFVRLTHKSIAPVRPVNNVIRRHCQVYLDPETFSW